MQDDVPFGAAMVLRESLRSFNERFEKASREAALDSVIYGIGTVEITLTCNGELIARSVRRGANAS